MDFLSVLAGGFLLVPGAGSQAAPPDVIAQDLPQPIPVERNAVAFVIEDGPLPQTTPLLLDALKKLGMKATFAVTGKNVLANPDIARRIVAEGHELANHTFSHPDLAGLNPDDFVRDLRAAEQAIMRVTGVRPRYFRATDGELSVSLRGEVRNEGYEVLEYTLDSGDWRNPPPGTVSRVILMGVTPGSVILTHDSFPKSVKEMPAVFELLVKRGFLLCTVSQLRSLASH